MIDDIISGVLVQTIGVTGRWLAAMWTAPHGRQVKKDLEIAKWFVTYQLSAAVPELPYVEAGELTTEELMVAIQRPETQAALHELMATRLTDAPETDVELVRKCFNSALSLPIIPHRAQISSTLFDYYDSEICTLVGRLQGAEPEMYRELRENAYSTRIVAILNALRLHASSLNSELSKEDEDQYIANYRRHVRDFHGKLQPPDFQRRQRIPIADLYVSPTILQVSEPQSDNIATAEGAPSRGVGLQNLADGGRSLSHLISLGQLSEQLDRTVLLGDPGGGKSTASKVLMHEYAGDPFRRIPFMVVLRDFASDGKPTKSVVAHIEDTLATLYQCPAPTGLVAHLFLSGRTMVIFDGLDELIDTSRRIEVTEVVEQFCLEYPLAKVLVTSRLVGYDQARLDNRQFRCYRLAGFNETQVVEYVRKWFAQDEGISAADVERWTNSFIEESANVIDLRSNPLMLALMCILYHGAGSIPRNRPEVYEQCAELLFRNWDARRHINVELRAHSLIEPALRHLAYWLFTRNMTQSAVTERELVRETTEFLRERGFESEGDAAEASSEFVEFCRGRAWVFSDAGTTANGDPLYTFTHRTFLEYFAASHLALTSDTPEKLAKTILPHVAKAEWEVVSELAVQKKEQANDRGAERTIKAMLDERRHRSPQGHGNVLQFLARCVASIEVPPRIIRELTRSVLIHLHSGDATNNVYYLPLAYLCSSPLDRCRIIAEEIAAYAAKLIESGDRRVQLEGLRLAIYIDISVHVLISEGRAIRNMEFWKDQAAEARRKYSAEILNSMKDDPAFIIVALDMKLISVADILNKDQNSFVNLLCMQPIGIFNMLWSAYLPLRANRLLTQKEAQDSEIDAFAIGEYLSRHIDLPWCVFKQRRRPDGYITLPDHDPVMRKSFDPIVNFGLFAVLCINFEMNEQDSSSTARQKEYLETIKKYVPELSGYITMRRSGNLRVNTPELPVPEQAREIFVKWAAREVDMCAFV